MLKDGLKKISLWSFILATSFLIPSIKGNSQEGVILDTYTIWESPPCALELVSNHQYTPLCHFKGSTYFVWVDSSHRPWVTKINKLVVETMPLDENPDFKAIADPHYAFSMGIDKKGYIHITGNMHNYTHLITGLYPKRYQGQQILYWKSLNPENITDGFEFVGGKNAPTAIPGTGFTYGRFFTDNDDNLYYSSRVKAINKAHLTGEMGLGVYAYDVDALEWKALGAKAEDTRPGVYYDVLLWENGGMGPDGWYQGFLANLCFDHRNILHMAATINSDSTLTGNNCLVYACSDDQGASWHKANGEPIFPLPLRAKDGLSNQAEIVRQVYKNPFLDSRVKVIADKFGTPGIINNAIYIHGENGWEKTDRFSLADTVDWDNQGNLVFTRSGSSRLLYSESLNSKPFSYEFKGFTNYQCIDANALKKTGVIYGVGIKNANSGFAQSILRTILVPAPLPEGWYGQDISYVPLMFNGTCGYKNCKFFVNNYGIHLGNYHKDSMYFVYTTLTGDGTITAKISLNGPNPNSRAGVMMRESLEMDSKDVLTIIAPNKNGAAFAFRSENGASSAESWKTHLQEVNWVRLQRKGNVFISFISKDGVEWTQIGKRTLSFPNTLYVGLASASYHNALIQNTVYESVSVVND